MKPVTVLRVVLRRILWSSTKGFNSFTKQKLSSRETIVARLSRGNCLALFSAVRPVLIVRVSLGLPLLVFHFLSAWQFFHGSPWSFLVSR